MELWKDIENFKGYKVSDQGQVMGPRGLLSLNNFLPYSTFMAKGKRLYVHRVVAQSFIGSSELQVNHIDGNKRNNRAENLEWVTAKENTRHKYEVLGVRKATHLGRVNKERSGEKHHKTFLLSSDILDIRNKYSSGEISQRDLALEYRCSLQTVNNIVRRITWAHIA